MIASALLAAALTVAQSGPACSGADPVITGVKVVSTTQNAGITRMVVSGKVRNRGNLAQAKNVLQSVTYDLNGTKTGSKGIAPLAAGASAPFAFTVERSSDAGVGTTNLDFHVVVTQPNPPGRNQCRLDDNSFLLTV